MTPNRVTGLLAVLGFVPVEDSWDRIQFRHPATGIEITADDLRFRLTSEKALVKYIFDCGEYQGVGRVRLALREAMGLSGYGIERLPRRPVVASTFARPVDGEKPNQPKESSMESTDPRLAEVQNAETLLTSLTTTLGNVSSAFSALKGALTSSSDKPAADELAALDTELTHMKSLFAPATTAIAAAPSFTPGYNPAATVPPSPTDPDQTPQPVNPPAPGTVPPVETEAGS